jgi:hypothetical protein
VCGLLTNIIPAVAIDVALSSASDILCPTGGSTLVACNIGVWVAPIS